MSAKMSQILGIRGFLRTWWAGTGAQPGPALDHASVEEGGGFIPVAVICSGIVPGIEPIALLGSSHFGVWGVVLAWGRGLPDD